MALFGFLFFCWNKPSWGGSLHCIAFFTFYHYIQIFKIPHHSTAMPCLNRGLHVHRVSSFHKTYLASDRLACEGKIRCFDPSLLSVGFLHKIFCFAGRVSLGISLCDYNISQVFAVFNSQFCIYLPVHPCVKHRFTQIQLDRHSFFVIC